MKGGSPSSFVLFYWFVFLWGGFTAVASVSCGCVCGAVALGLSRCNGGFVCTRLIGLLFSFGLVG